MAILDCNEMYIDPNISYLIKKKDEDLYYKDSDEFMLLEDSNLTVYMGDDLVNILPYLEFEYELVPYHIE